jgi:endoglucanase
MVEAYVLYGGVVGGPDSQDRFWDIRSDWVQGEVHIHLWLITTFRLMVNWFQVALDYNAPLLTLAAAHVMNDSADPFYTRLAAGAYAARKPKGQPCDASTNCDTNAAPKLPVVGQIVIGVVVTIVGLVVVGLSVCWGLLAVKNRRGSTGTAKSS